MRRIFLLLAASLLPLVAYSKDCLIVPTVSVCGVPLKAPQATFEKTFGEPDARINMGAIDGVGLLYGNNFIVIFRKGKLSEVQNWIPLPDRPWNWLNYVGQSRERIVLEKWNPWDVSVPAVQVNAALAKMPIVSGDEYAEIRRIRGGTLFVLYGEQEVGDHKERSDRVIYLEVNFEGEPIAP